MFIRYPTYTVLYIYLQTNSPFRLNTESPRMLFKVWTRDFERGYSFRLKVEIREYRETGHVNEKSLKLYADFGELTDRVDIRKDLA